MFGRQFVLSPLKSCLGKETRKTTRRRKVRPEQRGKEATGAEDSGGSSRASMLRKLQTPANRLRRLVTTRQILLLRIRSRRPLQKLVNTETANMSMGKEIPGCIGAAARLPGPSSSSTRLPAAAPLPRGIPAASPHEQRES
jgi:hypothetical protein